MTDIFADGIQSIAVSNGILRIELAQLKRGKSKTKLEPQPVGSLIIPVTALKDFTLQLANTLQQIQSSVKEAEEKGKKKKKGGKAKDDDDLDKALENL